jgi:hypothetical protein
MARIRAKKKETRDAVTMGMGTMRTDFLQQSTVQKGAVEEMRTERTKLLTASAGTGGNVDDAGNDIHDLSPDVNVVGLTGDDCDDENATPGRYDCGTMGGCGSDRCSGQSICKERGRVKHKEEEASSKEHDERRNNGAPPQRHEIEISGVKHPCPHFEFDPNNQNVEKKCALMVDGKKMFVDFHDLTKKERGRDGSRPRPILNSSVAKKLNNVSSKIDQEK